MEYELWHHATVEDLTDLICRFTPEGELTFVNPAYCRFLDRKPEDLVGSPFPPAMPNEDRLKLDQALASLDERSPVRNLECRVIKPDGQTAWIKVTLRALYSQDGRLEGYQSVADDVTELKRLEDKLLRYENKYRYLVENAGETMIVSQDGQVTLLNNRLSETSGYSPEEIQSRPLTDFIHPDDREFILDSYRKFVEDEPVDPQTECRLFDKDGQLHWVELRSSRIEWEGRPAALTLIRNVTQKKNAEEELRREEKYWKNTFDTVPDLITIIDPAHRIIRANKAMAELAGQSPSALIGQYCYRLMHSMDRPPDSCPHARLVRDGADHVSEIFEPNLQACFLVTCNKLTGDEGELIGSVHVARDITDLKAVQHERENLITQLQAALDEVKTLKGFIPICAHCKKIRDDQGYWQKLEQYIQDHSEATFSHGICPDCQKELYPDIFHKNKPVED